MSGVISPELSLMHLQTVGIATKALDGASYVSYSLFLFLLSEWWEILVWCFRILNPRQKALHLKFDALPLS